VRPLLSLVTVLLLAACAAAPPPESAARESSVSDAIGAPVVPADAPIVVAFGDSLTAGYGLRPNESYPSVLEGLLANQGTPYRIINEGVSGDTTSTALARADVAASHEAVLAIVAIGANDGLRGLPVDQMETNLREIVRRFQSAGRRVALVGMLLPPNMGPEYVGQFEAVYPRVAADMRIPLLPFLLEGVAADPDLNQDDGIHPNKPGARIVAQLVADFVTPILTSTKAAAQ
jgi:acyl-CoA thioesterase-1